MKKSLLALAVLGAFAGAAAAQTNVTMYGIADAGIGMQDSDAPTDSAVTVFSGVQSTSRFGVRGSEDLGGGLKAIFNIEAGMDSDVGSIDSDPAGSGGAMFQRRSVVGLAGNWGEVRLGRDYTTGFSAAGATDIMGYGLFGNWLNFTAGAGGITTRASNGIWYTSPAFGNTKFTGFYTTGETNVKPKDAGDGWGLAAVYRGGPATAQIYYQELNNAAGDAKKEMGLGGGWNFGAFRVTAAYGQSEAPTTGVKTKGYGLGGGVKLGAGEFLAQVMQVKVDTAADPKATIWGLAYVYPLSKRTNLYANYGTTRNNDAATFSLRASDNSVAAGGIGRDPSGFVVGVRHMF